MPQAHGQLANTSSQLNQCILWCTSAICQFANHFSRCLTEIWCSVQAQRCCSDDSLRTLL